MAAAVRSTQEPALPARPAPPTALRFPWTAPRGLRAPASRSTHVAAKACAGSSPSPKSPACAPNPYAAALLLSMGAQRDSEQRAISNVDVDVDVDVDERQHC